MAHARFVVGHVPVVVRLLSALKCLPDVVAGGCDGEPHFHQFLPRAGELVVGHPESEIIGDGSSDEFVLPLGIKEHNRGALNWATVRPAPKANESPCFAAKPRDGRLKVVVDLPKAA
jgi:hypothetical protein